MDQQQHYVGLDVSLETTSICVIDDKGTAVWRSKCASTLESITEAVHTYAPAAVRVGLETGQLSNWLTLNLRRRGLPVVCLDARHAKAALSLQINKTDANDAFGLAQIVRTGWYREVAVKSMDAQTLRMLLMARAQLVSQRQTIANTIRGLLKTFGLVIVRGANGLFPIRVREQIVGNDVLAAIVEPLLTVWHALREQIAIFDRQILARARADATFPAEARRLARHDGEGVVGPGTHRTGDISIRPARPPQPHRSTGFGRRGDGVRSDRAGKCSSRRQAFRAWRRGRNRPADLTPGSRYRI